jgi:MspA
VRTLCPMGVIVVGLLVGNGVAAADPVPVADVTQSADTDTGWHLSASLTNMTINSVPNMAATAFTREGFLTGKATATIDGNGKIPVQSGTVILAAQLGCQVDLSQGGSISIGGDVGFSLGGGTGVLGIPGGFGPYADFYPSVSVNLLPGKISTVVLGNKALKGRIGEITVHEAHVKVDGCGGPVALRLVAYAQISTDTGDDSVNTYGDILNL